MAFFRLEWRASAAKELRKIDRQMIPRIVEARQAQERSVPVSRVISGSFLGNSEP